MCHTCTIYTMIWGKKLFVAWQLLAAGFYSGKRVGEWKTQPNRVLMRKFFGKCFDISINLPSNVSHFFRLVRAFRQAKMAKIRALMRSDRLRWNRARNKRAAEWYSRRWCVNICVVESAGMEDNLGGTLSFWKLSAQNFVLNRCLISIGLIGFFPRAEFI